jgi:Xaa-Pro dipeptidase
VLRYDIDIVLTTDQVNTQLSSTTVPKTTVFAISGHVSDDITFLAFNSTDFSLLRDAVDTARVVKDTYEIALMKKANRISAEAHMAVLNQALNVTNERHLEAAFLKVCWDHGVKRQSYHPVVAAGTAAATLHYNDNDKDLKNKQLVLLDAGGELNVYCSDITRTFPISGTFTPEAKSIYNIVLRMQEQCIHLLKAGAVWDGIHMHAHRVLIDGLLHLGILKGDRNDIFEARTSVAFFPHGLGHYLGMDTHDTGGHANYEDPDSMFRYLRVRGAVPAGCVITVEPGCYFCRFIIEPYLKDPQHSKYIDERVLERYWEVGGVRIEDNLFVTEDGWENWTNVPKTAEEIEKILKEGKKV